MPRWRKSFAPASWAGSISSLKSHAERTGSLAASARSHPKRLGLSSPTPSSERKASTCWALRGRDRRCARHCGGSAISFALRKTLNRRGDGMRAKLPDRHGFTERDGVKLYYEVYGEGPETMVFVPPWSIVHSRIYKAQLPYFSERFRCIAYDGRGNGMSGRPAETAAYSLDHYIAD